MKVLILTEGGKNIGFGHITRCISLCQAFEEREILPELVVNGKSKGVIEDLLKDRRYKAFDWLKEKKRIFNLIKNADVVVIDSYLAGFDFYKEVSELVKVPVYIDDYKRMDYPRGIVVNGSIYAEGLAYPQRRDVVYLLGCKYTPLRKEFWNISKKTINRKIKKALITFGGMGHSDLMYNLVDYLKNRFGLTVSAVETKKIRFKARKMLVLMLKNDLCISGGGQTTYELSRCGIPTIGICFADNQSLNLKELAKAGGLMFAGWYNDKNLLKKIEEALTILNYKDRIKVSQIGRSLVDGQGARRVVREILK